MNDVLIIGAGPTGLTLAYLLIKTGISVRIIDEKEGPEPFSKAVGIQARTLEIFEKIGIIDPFLNKGLKAKSLHLHLEDKEREIFLDIDSYFSYVLLLPQYETEKIFIDSLRNFGLEIEWKTKFVSFENKAALLEKQGVKEKVESIYILGCDGAHSQVRRALNFSFKGKILPEHFLLVDVDYTSPEKIMGPHIFLKRRGFMAALPFLNLSRLVFILSKKEFDEKNAEKVLSERLDTRFMRVNKIEWISFFQVHRRMTTQLRKGNVFLIGDAAHVHSPAGGQGMNTSIHEAFNLSWKLILEIRGVANPQLLDSYEKERVPIAKKVLKTTTLITNVVGFLAKWGNPFIYNLFIFFISHKWAQKLFSKTISELWVNYEQSPIIKDEGGAGPKAGFRAPDFIMNNGKRFFTRLVGEKHQLLLFEEKSTFTKKIKDLYGDWIEVIVLNEAKKTYRANENSCYLIRPDGMIGYKTHHLDEKDFFTYLKGIFNL